MPKKKSNREKAQLIYENSDHLKRLLELLDQLRYRRRPEMRGTTYSGTTKSWLTDSRRCPKHNQPHQYPQLIELTTASSSIRQKYFPPWWNPPPPGYLNINTLFRFASSRSYDLNLKCTLVVTQVSNPAFMVCTWPDYWGEGEGEGKERRLITHKSMEIDPYDADNQVMKFNYVIRSESDRKYYALSSQGALVMMEQIDAHRIIVTGICRTRAVPSFSSVSAAKYFKEYLFESRGDILLVFLIFKESINSLADEIEVYRLDLDVLKLVKVKKLQGRALFLENECCVWVDSREIGCKGDCVYFTGELGDGWWMYDLGSRSISPDCRDVPEIQE